MITAIRPRRKAQDKEWCVIVLVLAVCWLLASGTHASAGITSPLYVTGDWSAQRTDDTGPRQIYVLQGTDVVNWWTKIGLWQGAIAVVDTVRTNGIDNGAEYTLSGTFTGVRFAGWGLSAGAGIFDGATDGTYNYAARYHTVYRFGRDWADGVPLFEDSGGSGYAGITYDPSNNSLWLSDTVRGTIENRSLSGTLLSSFSASQPTFLAMDYADGTLWTAPYDGNILNQYSRMGTPLSSQTFLNSLGNQVWFGDFPGGEFPLSPSEPVPAPGALILGVCGLAYAMKRLRAAKTDTGRA